MNSKKKSSLCPTQSKDGERWQHNSRMERGGRTIWLQLAPSPIPWYNKGPGWQTCDNRSHKKNCITITKDFSPLLLALVDSDHKCILSSVGDHRSTSDCAVFNVSPLKAESPNIPPPRATPRRRQTSTILLVAAQNSYIMHILKLTCITIIIRHYIHVLHTNNTMTILYNNFK